jgi:CheY-like chemotaxis protein
MKGPFMTEGPSMREHQTLGSILVVDDDPGTRDAIQEILADAGYEVRVAHHGAMALEVLEATRRPCLILLDVRMPVMDGRDFLAQLRQHPAYSQIPVVVCTANERELPPGAQALLKKPFELDELLATVRAHCG